jgi:hypothetical protein
MTIVDANAVELSELRSLIARMDQLLTPDLRAAVDNAGNPGAVAAGELIESTWGNAVKDRVVQRYATDAALRAATPPFGQLATSPELSGTVWWRTTADGWVRPIARSWAHGVASAPTSGGNANMTMQQGRNWSAQDSWGVRCLVEGTYVITLNALFYSSTGGAPQQVAQASLAFFNPSTPGTPYQAIPAFTAMPSQNWAGVNLAWVQPMSVGDFIRVAVGGDVPNLSLDNRTTWSAGRITSYP